jgi:hypothetical protein
MAFDPFVSVLQLHRRHPFHRSGSDRRRQTILGLASLTAVVASLTDRWATHGTDTTNALQIAEANVATCRAERREQRVRKATTPAQHLRHDSRTQIGVRRDAAARGEWIASNARVASRARVGWTRARLHTDEEKIGKERRARWWCVGRDTRSTATHVFASRTSSSLIIGWILEFGNIEFFAGGSENASRRFPSNRT